MASLDPDFFLCSGDTIYADNPIEPRVTLADGRIWRNITTEEKAKVAETLDEFRGNFRYNLLDEPLRRFNARVPWVVQWDDHEVHNNWYPGQLLDDDRYTEKRAERTLADRALRAFGEAPPRLDAACDSADRAGRVYRSCGTGPARRLRARHAQPPAANSPGREADDTVGILGAEQLAWLKRELSRSRAVWKVIASDMPLGLVVLDADKHAEAVAQGDPGAPLGRELQIAELLRHIKDRRITGTPGSPPTCTTPRPSTTCRRAAFRDFAPFWKSRGRWRPAASRRWDWTRPSGPTRSSSGCPPGQRLPRRVPAVLRRGRHRRRERELTVRLRAEGGRTLFRKTLQPGLVGQ
ncbi:alkaline phosphatase D family protein [Streptomyces albidoflavus]